MANKRNQSVGGSAAIDAWMDASTHSLTSTMQAVRKFILGLDPAIGEEIKWNAPSFHLGEHFATMNLRQPDAVRVILHRGAKARPLPTSGLVIDDRDDLLEWLGPDRALLTFHDSAEVETRRPALAPILRQWIAQL